MADPNSVQRDPSGRKIMITHDTPEYGPQPETARWDFQGILRKVGEWLNVALSIVMGTKEDRQRKFDALLGPKKVTVDDLVPDQDKDDEEQNPQSRLDQDLEDPIETVITNKQKPGEALEEASKKFKTEFASAARDPETPDPSPIAAINPKGPTAAA